MRACAAVFAVLIAACNKPSSGPVCTEIGCVDGLQVELTKAGPWAPGRYTFTFALDGAAVTCAGSLPLKPCEAGPSLTCEPAGRVRIGESGCALEPAAHGFSDILVPRSAPARVDLAIARDGAELQRATLTPTYAVVRPNGPRCAPECRSARASVAVP